jgi:hypothetical protein
LILSKGGHEGRTAAPAEARHCLNTFFDQLLDGLIGIEAQSCENRMGDIATLGAWAECSALASALFGVLARIEIDGNFVDLAREPEGHVIPILDQRDAGAGVLADVEVLIFRKRDRGGVLD